MNKIMLKKTNHSLFLTVGLSSITIVSGIICSSLRVNADDNDTTVSTASVTVQASCSMTATIDTAHTANIPNGIYSGTSLYPNGIGKTTIATFCNDNSGYAIYAIGFTGDKYEGTDHTKLIGQTTTEKISTGTATSGDTSNWAMKLTKVTDSTESYNPQNLTITNGYDTFTAVPDTYTKVANYTSTTDKTLGSVLSTTYAAYISTTQPADTYTGKVKYTLVHPNTEIPAQPQPSTAGYINYYANASTAVGTMGRQTASDGATRRLFASNFSREGYGFAGWSDAFDYATNPNAHFYGPNEDIILPTGATENGLALYAVWVESAGIMQTDGASVCSSLTAATYDDEGDADESTWSISADLSSISALTDIRDNQTYAIAKLSDGKCWMIENLRLDNTPELTSANTNNPSLPLTNVYDTSSTSNHLSPTSSIAYDASTAPEGWCNSYTANCDDQSRLRTDNTTDRVTYTTTESMSSNANFYSYGNYYNWYSATAGHGKHADALGDTAPGDICPAGWRLPTGSGSGEFGLLSNSLGGYKDTNDVAQTMYSTTTPNGATVSKRLRHFPNNLLYSGSVGVNYLSNRGNSGSFFSSTAYSNDNTYYLNYNASEVKPGTSGSGKAYGHTVRCIATPSS